MTASKLKFSLITSFVLLLSSFMPFIQISMLMANGAFLKLLTHGEKKIILSVNGILSLIMLSLFYYARSIIIKIFSTIGFFFFFLSLFFYSTESIFTDETGSLRFDNLYFLQFFLAGLTAGILLAAMELIKAKRSQ